MLRLRYAPLSMTILLLLVVALILHHRFQKVIKQKLRILRAAGGFWVKLGGEERFGFVLDAFAGAIVQVLK